MNRLRVIEPGSSDQESQHLAKHHLEICQTQWTPPNIISLKQV